MLLVINREILGQKSTVGRLSIDGAHFGFTLEDRVRDPGVKVKGETAIADGEYDVIIDHSKHFGRSMPHILGVPLFEGIRLHWGATELDTEGCPLVGHAYTRVGNDYRLFGSLAAFDELFEKLKAAVARKERIRIRIVNGPSALDERT